MKLITKPSVKSWSQFTMWDVVKLDLTKIQYFFELAMTRLERDYPHRAVLVASTTAEARHLFIEGVLRRDSLVVEDHGDVFGSLLIGKTFDLERVVMSWTPAAKLYRGHGSLGHPFFHRRSINEKASSENLQAAKCAESDTFPWWIAIGMESDPSQSCFVSNLMTGESARNAEELVHSNPELAL